MTVDARDGQSAASRDGPCRAGSASSTPDIEHCGGGSRDRLIQRAENMHARQEMQGCIEQRKSGSFSGAVERTAAADGVTPLHVRRRQGPERTCHFGQPQIRQVTPLECPEPLFEGHGQMTIPCSLANGVRDSDRVTGVG
jgi:hypothetical protein